MRLAVTRVVENVSGVGKEVADHKRLAQWLNDELEKLGSVYPIDGNRAHCATGEKFDTWSLSILRIDDPESNRWIARILLASIREYYGLDPIMRIAPGDDYRASMAFSTKDSIPPRDPSRKTLYWRIRPEMARVERVNSEEVQIRIYTRLIFSNLEPKFQGY